MYKYVIDHTLNTCYFYNKDSEYLGMVRIDNTGAWSVKYAEGVKYLPINDGLKELGYMENPIFTSHKLNAGQVFDFYSDENTVHIMNDIIFVWSERDQDGLGDKIIYGKARVIDCPIRPSGLYKAMMLSS